MFGIFSFEYLRGYFKMVLNNSRGIYAKFYSELEAPHEKNYDLCYIKGSSNLLQSCFVTPILLKSFAAAIASL